MFLTLTTLAAPRPKNSRPSRGVRWLPPCRGGRAAPGLAAPEPTAADAPDALAPKAAPAVPATSAALPPPPLPPPLPPLAVFACSRFRAEAAAARSVATCARLRG